MFIMKENELFSGTGKFDCPIFFFQLHHKSIFVVLSSFYYV